MCLDRLHLNLIVARTDAVFLVPCVCFLGVSLPDQLALVVLLVTKDVVVRRDGWWIRHYHLLLRGLFCPLVAADCTFLVPFRRTVILAWTWYFRVLLVLKVFLKTLDFGGKSVIRLDQLNSKLVKTKLVKSLGTLHRPINVIETVSCVIGAGSCKATIMK